MYEGAAILHADLDAFYASVEQLLDPSLRGRPIAVGGSAGGGVVLAASYEAKHFGVSGGMPGRRARELCPHITFVRGHFDRYQQLADSVMAILHSVTPEVERISIDEAFLDVSGSVHLFGPPDLIADRLRRQVRREVGLPISVGVARTKHLAKVASQVAKPDGLVVVAPEREQEFLAPLPVGLMWGIGPVAQAKLKADGIRTIGQLAEASPGSVQQLLGAAVGQKISALAHNEDARRVTGATRARSVGAQSAMGRADATPETVRAVLNHLADRVAVRLRAKHRAGRTVTVRVRYPGMRSVTRSLTLEEPVAATLTLTEIAEQLAWQALRDELRHQAEAHRAELEEAGLDGTEVDEAGLDEAGLDESEVDAAGLDRAEEDGAGLVEADLEGEGSNEAVLDRASRHMTSQRGPSQGRNGGAKSDRSGGDHARAELARPEPARSEHAKAEHVRSEHGKAEEARSEHASADQAKLEHARPGPVRPEQGRAERGRLEQARPEHARSDHAKAEQVRPVPVRSEQAKPGQGRSEYGRAEQARPEQVRSERAKAEHAEAEQGSPEHAWSDYAEAKQGKPEHARSDHARSDYAKAHPAKPGHAKPDHKRPSPHQAGQIQISLLAISVSNLVVRHAVQQELAVAPDDPRREGTESGAARLAVDSSMDAVRAKFGRDAVGYLPARSRGGVPDEFRELAEKEV